jgi:hypothetical protein
MTFSLKLFVMLKKLSLEYHPYACGNFFRMPRFWTKIIILQKAQITKYQTVQYRRNG